MQGHHSGWVLCPPTTFEGFLTLESSPYNPLCLGYDVNPLPKTDGFPFKFIPKPGVLYLGDPQQFSDHPRSVPAKTNHLPTLSRNEHPVLLRILCGYKSFLSDWLPFFPPFSKGTEPQAQTKHMCGDCNQPFGGEFFVFFQGIPNLPKVSILFSGIF